MKLINILFTLVLTLLFQPAIATNADDTAMVKAILFHINEYRVQHHYKPFALNAFMSKEATQHSREMAEHKMGFGHDGFEKRIKRCFDEFKLGKRGSGAENVAYNYKNAKHVVSEWIKSPGHLRNIRGNYNLTGIGIARDKKGKIYFTEIFMRT